MTGFARVRRSLPEGSELVVGIKSVNHRGLDIHFHMPPDFDAYESAMRACIKQRVARGRVDLYSATAPVTAGAAMLVPDE